MQAVALDDSDVTVWYHLGVVALKTFDLCLARRSFEEVCSVCTRKLRKLLSNTVSEMYKILLVLLATRVYIYLLG